MSVVMLACASSHYRGPEHRHGFHRFVWMCLVYEIYVLEPVRIDETHPCPPERSCSVRGGSGEDFQRYSLTLCNILTMLSSPPSALCIQAWPIIRKNTSFLSDEWNTYSLAGGFTLLRALYHSPGCAVLCRGEDALWTAAPPRTTHRPLICHSLPSKGQRVVKRPAGRDARSWKDSPGENTPCVKVQRQREATASSYNHIFCIRATLSKVPRWRVVDL